MDRIVIGRHVADAVALAERVHQSSAAIDGRFHDDSRGILYAFRSQIENSFVALFFGSVQVFVDFLFLCIKKGMGRKEKGKRMLFRRKESFWWEPREFENKPSPSWLGWGGRTCDTGCWSPRWPEIAAIKQRWSSARNRKETYWWGRSLLMSKTENYCLVLPETKKDVRYGFGCGKQGKDDPVHHPFHLFC